MKLAFIVSAFLLPLAGPAPSRLATYSLVKVVPLGPPDRWDYVVYDDQTHRIYIAHADRLDVVDARTGHLVGEVRGIPGRAHGSAVAFRTGQGFTVDGINGQAIAFDLETLKISHRIALRAGADAVAYDSLTQRIFIVEADSGTLTVVDAKTDAPVATISAGEELEYAAGDGAGAIYVAGEGNGDLLKIDAQSNRVVARWPAPGCTSPHGIAVDRRHASVFMGCPNSVMMVVDVDTGRVTNRLPIGHGSDAIALDPIRQRVFSSNGADGTVSGYELVAPSRYVPLGLIVTTVSARTMAVDPSTGRLFVVGADTDPDPTGGRPHVRPGTLRLMIFEPRP